MQQVKQDGREVETMVLDDIAARMQKEQSESIGWILGTGELILQDATEQQRWALLEQGGDWLAARAQWLPGSDAVSGELNGGEGQRCCAMKICFTALRHRAILASRQ